MKSLGLLLACVFAFSTVSFSQDSTKTSGVDVYAAAGLSIGNSGDSTFAFNSYPSVEVGIMKGNFAVAAVFGRGNNVYIGKDNINNYWWEVKSCLYFPIKDSGFSGYGLLGVGNYMGTKSVFVEYGLGFSYAWNNFGVFAQASNWDRAWYVTPGISYTF